jgi:hypothetical protein
MNTLLNFNWYLFTDIYYTTLYRRNFSILEIKPKNATNKAFLPYLRPKIVNVYDKCAILVSNHIAVQLHGAKRPLFGQFQPTACRHFGALAVDIVKNNPAQRPRTGGIEEANRIGVGDFNMVESDPGNRPVGRGIEK